MVSHSLRSIGVPCSLYVEDRHNGKLQVRNFQAAVQPSSTSPTCDARLSAAKAAVFLAAYTLTCLGYTLGLKKCVFEPQKKMKYLCFVSDTDLEAFYLPDDKQKKFLELVNSILSGNTVPLNPSVFPHL